MDLRRMLQDLVLTPIADAAAIAVEFLPRVGLAALILLVSVPLAVLAREITARFLQAIGLDVLSDRTGFARLLEKGGVNRRPSRILGLFLYWVIIFAALIMVFNVLGIPAGAQVIQQVLALFPKFLALLVIASLGIFLGRFMGRVIQASSLIARVPFAAALGRLASYTVMGLALVAALRFVQFIPEGVTGTLAAIAVGAPVLVGVAVLIGSRRTLSCIVAGRFLRDQLRPGDSVSFDGIRGEVEAVQLVSTRLRDGTEQVIIANADLAAKVIRRTAAPSAQDGHPRPGPKRLRRPSGQLRQPRGRRA